MNVEELKSILRRGRKCKTIYVVHSYVSTQRKVYIAQPSKVVSTVIFVPLHIRRIWVDVEIYAAEENFHRSISMDGIHLYGRIGYEQFSNFREWSLEDAPLTINFKNMSKEYKELAFGA